jgi:OH-DDVA meta-cleavage compound hydrolase
MIIDCHAHLSPPPELNAYRKWLLETDGSEGIGDPKISDDAIRAALNNVDNDKNSGPFSHLDGMLEGNIDVQLLSPRPNQMMHSHKIDKVVQYFAKSCNDIIYRTTQLWQDKFIGIAGLPQTAGKPVDAAVQELERCVTELGFKGCMLNPDPFENSGPKSPPLWDPYWHPLYEKLVELDVPCHIHGMGQKTEREAYNHYYIDEVSTAILGFVGSNILDDFPELKILASHGGGSIPYQMGRYIAGARKHKQQELGSKFRKIYYDTVLHDSNSTEFLIKVMGVDNVLFGTEWPGLGSVIDPDTGRTMDNLAPAINDINWLSQEDKDRILCRNAENIFNLHT